MDEKYLKILEFDKVINILESCCVSEMGRNYVKELVPLVDIEEVESAQKETLDGYNYIMKKGNPPLNNIYDLENHLKRINIGAVLTPRELLNIHANLKTARIIIQFQKRDKLITESNLIVDLINSLGEDRKLEEDIYRSILSEDEIADEASSKLASIRRQIINTQNSIKEKLNNILRSTKYQKYMQDTLVTLRSERYVIPVKQEYRSEVPGLIHDSSSSGATIFIEPMAVVEANNEIRELKIKENQEIDRILEEFTIRVSEKKDMLKENTAILAQIDFIIAKAKLSIKYNCVPPIINEKGIIDIKEGRHPLIPQDVVVPINFWIGKTFKSVVITGPNTGGKTVTLKTTGLMCLLAQAGLHIPAKEGTEVAIFNEIFADIGDEQSIEQSLSTFSSHMRNIVSIINKADDRSLILFDELGAGTDPVEGAALAIGILEYLNELNIATIATTHYSELKMYAVSNDYIENACCEFDIETLKPTYKLLIGVPGKSNAFAISKVLGLSDYVLNKARNFLSNENIKFEDVLYNIEKNRSDIEKEKMEFERIRKEAEKLRNELKVQKEKLDEKKEKILKQAREEAKKIFKEAKDRTEEYIKEMNKLKTQNDELAGIRFAEKSKLELKKDIDEIESNNSKLIVENKDNYIKPDSINVGDEVYIKTLGQKGIVISVSDKNDDLMVQVGIIKINANFSDIYIDKNRRYDTKIEHTVYVKRTKSSSPRVVPEIDLRGNNIEEAIEKVDKYLDDVSMAGLGEVTIIHGKGTGVLRSGIQDFLKTHPHVKKFRIGKYGEGENGVTIVTIK